MCILKSFLHPTPLAETVCREYGFADVRCQLITATMRDVYEVTSSAGRYILMVYPSAYFYASFDCPKDRLRRCMEGIDSREPYLGEV